MQNDESSDENRRKSQQSSLRAGPFLPESYWPACGHPEKNLPIPELSPYLHSYTSTPTVVSGTEFEYPRLGYSNITFPMVGLLLVSFFLSGCSALVAEFVWLRMLTSSLGGSSASLNAILIAFMGGLSLGASLAKSLARRLIKPLYAYVLIELFLAGYLAASPGLIRLVNETTISILPDIGSEPFRNIVRLFAAALAVGPATVAMGVTTPLLIASVVRNPENTAFRAGMLYGINTFGGMCGALAAGCYLFLKFGITSTLRMAAGLNILAAVISLPAYWWSSRTVAANPQNKSLSSRHQEVSIFLIFALASGFCGMALEIIFARFLLFTVGGSYFSHTIIISGFLGGIFVGSLILGLWSARKNVSGKNVPVLFYLFGLSSLLSTLLYPLITSFIQSVFVERRLLSLPPLTTKFLAAFLVTLLPAAVSGMILPMLAGIAAQTRQEVAIPVSRIFAWNTVGAVLGVCVTGNLVIDSLGVRSAAIVISLLLFLLGLLAGKKLGNNRPAGYLGAAACLLLLLFAPRYPLVVHSVIYKQLGRPPVLHYSEDDDSSVSVLDYPVAKERALMTNGLEEARVYGARDPLDMGWLADISLLSHPSPRSLFVAGLGTGSTAGVAGIYPNLKVTVVEISSAVIEALPFFDPFTFNASRNPSIRLLRGDARNYLLTSKEQFDVINNDVYISALTGTSYLYNLEFYEICKNRIREDGRVLVLADLNQPIERVKAKTFCTALPYVKAIFVPALQYFFLIGGKQELNLDHPVPEDWKKNRLLVDRLQFLGVSVDKSLSRFPYLSRQGLMERLRDVPVCTDDRPVMDFMVGLDNTFVW